MVKQNDATGGANFFVVPSGDKPYLLDPAVVDGLLREFVGRVVDNTVAVAQVKMTAEAAGADFLKEIERMGRIFYGEDPAYQATPWNSPSQVGLVIMKRHPVEQDPAVAAQHFFLLLGQGIIEAIDKNAAGEMTDQDAKDMLEAEIETGVETLLGLPSDEFPDDEDE